MTAADTASRRPGPGALALVLDDLDRLPRVDDRYRLWPWSQRALAQRRRCSPGTVHKHHQALAAAGVLVTDDQGRTLVDTTRLRHTGPGEPAPACSRGRRSTSAAISQQPDNAPSPGGEADVLVAIEALTTAVEARPDLAAMLTPLIGRLARLLEHTPATSAAPVARPQPRDDESGARGHRGGEVGVDLGRCTGSTARPSARGRAPLKKERKNQHSHSEDARDGDLPGLSFSPDHEPRATWDARPGRSPEGRAGARPAERLLELLGPLDPAQHVTYLEGVQAALAGYNDAQVAHAVNRIVVLDKATINPVGLLVDRAHANDPLFFPPTSREADERVAEPPAELWSTDHSRQPTEPTPDDHDIETVPEFDPDPALAPALAARAALEAAHQPVTRGQLAARQAERPDDGDADGGEQAA